MIINILTLFPEMFRGVFRESIIGRAQKKGLVKINLVNLRDFAVDKHKSCDDKPYGGGPGMIMRVDIIDKALSALKAKSKKQKAKIILLSPRGKKYDQQMARKLSKLDEITLVCGHYEGVDERATKLVDKQISIGDYILTGGEIAAMAIVDSMVRLIPNVIKKESLTEESFGPNIRYPISDIRHLKTEYPQYTQPAVYKGRRVPRVLLSGNHQKIKEWRETQISRS